LVTVTPGERADDRIHPVLAIQLQLLQLAHAPLLVAESGRFRLSA